MSPTPPFLKQPGAYGFDYNRSSRRVRYRNRTMSLYLAGTWDHGFTSPSHHYITSLLTLVTLPTFHHALHRASSNGRPLPTKNRAANWWPCILCRRTLCIEIDGIACRQNWNSCGRRQQHSGAIWSLFFSYGVLTMQCTIRLITTHSAVTVTVTIAQSSLHTFS